MRLPDESLIAIGKIVRCIGVRGQVKVLSLSPSLKRFEKLKEVFLCSEEKETKLFFISTVEIRNKFVVLAFKEIVSRNESESLIGNYVCVPISERIQLPENSWFIDDIIGSQVFEFNEEIGTLIDVISAPAQNIWVVRNNNTKELWIPVIPETIERVDSANKKIYIRLPNGLRDI